MPIIEVTKDFAFAERGIYVTEYARGQITEVSDECAECAIAEKWAKPSKKAPEHVDVDAPETTSFEFAPETK
jgi:hypothetical protein